MLPRRSGRLLLGLLLAGCLLGPVLPAWAQQRAFQYLRQEQNLENLAVTALVQDGAGELWIGTENGLYRFDGTRIRRYGPDQGLTDPRVISLHVDASGLLWVGTLSMLLHREKDEFRQVKHEGESIVVQPGQSLSSTRDRVVVNTARGLYWIRRGVGGWEASEVFAATARKQQPELGWIVSVLAEPGGDVWFGCSKALCRIGEGGLRVYRSALGTTVSHPLTSLMRAADGRLWLRSSQQLWQLDFGAEALHDVELPPAGDLPAPMSPALIADGAQRVLTQWGSGIARWDGRKWEVVGIREGLQAGGGVSALLSARDGGVWLGTAGAGLAHWLGYRHAQSWSQAEGLPSDDSWAFLRSSSGAFYFGTAAGLAVGASEQASRGVPLGRRGESADFASSLAEDAEGRLWVGSFNGSLRVRDPAVRQLRQVARLPRITGLLVDPLRQLWVITHQGIYVMPDPSRDRQLRRIDKPSDAPRPAPLEAHDACIAADGQVWIATRQGLLRGNGQQLVRIRLRDAKGGTPAEQDFAAIACGKDRLWIASTSGLWQARVELGDTLRLDRVDAPVLQGRSIVSLHEDRRGWLWAGTDYGVAVSNMNRWRVIRQEAGLPWNDCNQTALYEDRDGSMWVGTSRGAAHLSEVDSLFETPQLDVRIEMRDPMEQLPGEPAILTVPWQKHGLTLHLASAALEQRGALRFEHRIQGLDDGWRSGSETELVYPALPPGRYRFEARVRNLDLQAESPLESRDIEVLPPWWRTVWFYGAMALLTASLAWVAYRWRLGSILRHQRHLELLVSERTREIEASHARMRELALKDGLTGVLNRRALGEALAAEVSRAGRNREPLTVVLVDADRFKQVNDRYGHQAGDAVLVTMAQRLQALTRPYDHLGRYGGEEFVLVLPQLDVARPEGRARIDAFHRAISASPIMLAMGARLDVTCSFGVAGVTGDRLENPDEVIARADAALYRAKANGRNRVEYGV